MRHTKTKAAERKGSIRVERLGFRLEKATKALIRQAARLEGRKITEFCVSTLTDAAQKTIEQHELLVLSDRDRTVFFQALAHPPAPNKRLIRAFMAERDRVSD